MAAHYPSSSPRVIQAILNTSSRSRLGYSSRLSPIGSPFNRRSPPARPFHLETLYHASVQSSDAIITGLHTLTHTPWCLTIPLVALGVNVLFRLPWSIHSRKIIQKRVKLTPLIQAWFWRLKKDGFKESSITDLQQAEKEFNKKFQKQTKRLYKEFGLQSWKQALSISVFPFWLLAIESIRRLSGHHQGLLSLLLLSKDAQATAGEDASSSSQLDSQSVASSLSSDKLPGEAGVVPTDSAAGLDVTSSITPDAVSEMMTEGCLWFPDLTVADPYHVLPIMLSAMLVINVMPSTAAGRRALLAMKPSTDAELTTRNTTSPFGLRFQRALLLFSALLGPLTLNLPAALHLYWLSSAASTYLLRYAVEKTMPVTKALEKPCTPNTAHFIRIKRKQ